MARNVPRLEAVPPAAAELERLLRNHNSSKTSELASIRIDPSPIRSNRSWIYRARLSDGTGMLAVKVYKPEMANRKSTAEFAMLERFYRAMPQQGASRIPRPVAVIPEQNILVMEWVEAPNMNLLLRRPWLSRKRRHHLIKSAGQWLHSFHDAAEPRLGPLDAHELVSRITQRFRAHGRREFTDSRLAAVHGAAIENAHRFEGWPVEYVTAHGDFAARNLLVGQDTVTGIDINGIDHWPALTDACHFIFDVEDSGYGGTIIPPWGRCDIASTTATAFIEGYGPTLGDLPRPLANFLLLVEVLRRAVVVERSMLFGKGGKRRGPELIRLRRRAEQTARLLEER